MDKIRTAAISGVLAFLESEREATRDFVKESTPLPSASPWVSYGRMWIMQTRSLAQSRYLRRGMKSPIYRVMGKR
jgi:hypothetical protein